MTRLQARRMKGVQRMKTIVFSLGLLALPMGRLSAEAPSPHQARDSTVAVRAYLDTLEAAGFSGSVLVELHGRVVISDGFGYSDMSQERRNSPRTVFDIGSVTKQFTAAAILKLEMEGKLSTEDKLSMYFKSVPGDKSEISIHHLLRHSSGLRSTIGRDYERIGEKEFIDSVMRSPLRFPVGTAFSYSNIGYSLLAMIIERVAGVPYEAYLYENLWRPAGMEQTGYQRPKFSKENLAIGYTNEDQSWGRPTDKEWDVDGPYWHLKGNGGILSTVEDLFRWNQALSTHRILSESAKAKMYHPRLREGEDSGSYYGYGWDVHRTDRNTVVLWHNGSNGIFYADVFRFVDEQSTIIILTNKTNGFGNAGREIARALFDPSYRPEVPVADNEANRSFTDSVAIVTSLHGFEAGAEKLRVRRPGVNLLEERVNNRGYQLLGGGKRKEAISLFKINTLAFPNSSNAYDSLGEGYLADGDTLLAIENYRKSLTLDPANGNAEIVLKQLLTK